MTLAEARLIFPPIWTIYDRPKDYPAHVVVRCWWGEVPEPEPLALCWSLIEAREAIALAGGCMPLARSPQDDGCIVESWV